MRSEAIGAAIALVLCAGPAQAQVRYPQARANYEAVLNGSRQISQLSPQELVDVLELDRRLRARKADGRAPSQRCIDAELENVNGAASPLARRAIDMKCREAGD